MIRESLEPVPRDVPNRRGWIAAAVVAGLFAAVPIVARRMRDASSSAPALVLNTTPRALPDLRFADAHGTPTSLTAFRGRVLLLNVWATWCSPCREEMPTLDRLQAALVGPDFEVLALSIDTGGVPVVRGFLRSAGTQHLRPYIDAFGDAATSFGASGVPLTLLVDRQGREVSRKLGPAAWDHPDVLELIRRLVAQDPTE